MPRHDRKRWWDDTPNKAKGDNRRWFGITEEKTLIVRFDKNWMRLIKKKYSIIPYHPRISMYINQKMTLEEAKALCVMLNAASKNDDSYD